MSHLERPKYQQPSHNIFEDYSFFFKVKYEGKVYVRIGKHGELNNLEKLYEKETIVGCKMNIRLTIYMHCDPVTKPLGVYGR